MKDIKCKTCGDIIQNGWNINPANSDECENCALEITEEENII